MRNRKHGREVRDVSSKFSSGGRQEKGNMALVKDREMWRMNKDEDYKDDFWERKDILGEKKKKQDDRGSAKNNQLIPYIIILNLP